MKSDKTVTNLDLTTKDNVTRDSFKKTYKTFRLYCGFISYKQNDDITDINMIQEYEVKAGVKQYGIRPDNGNNFKFCSHQAGHG